jgi:cation transport ATPase
MLLAATGHLHPVVAALLMTGSSAVVSWRAWRGGSCHPAESDVSTRLARWHRGGMGLGFLLQPPLLIGLGNLSWFQGAVVSVMGLLGAWFSGRGSSVPSFSSPRLSAPDWRPMVWGMLGPANLAMLVGWWADADFGRVVREGVCLCCSGHRYFSLASGIPWMTVAMVVSGLPFMMGAILAWPRTFQRIGVAATLSLSMAAGMNQGASLMLRWAGPGHPWQFLIAYAGMTFGMMAGMLFACGLTEALRHRFADGSGHRAVDR